MTIEYIFALIGANIVGWLVGALIGTILIKIFDK